MPLLEVEHLHARYDFAPVLQGISFNRRCGRDRQHLRPQRRRQDDDPAHHHGLAAAGRRARSLSTASRSADCRRIASSAAASPSSPRIAASSRRLSVEENLMLGLFSLWQSGAEQRRQLDRVFDLFPRLRERRRQLGKTLVRRRAADAGDRPRADRQLRSCCWSTSRPKGLRPSSSTKSSNRSRACGTKASRCCWSSRTSAAPPPSAIPAT